MIDDHSTIKVLQLEFGSAGKVHRDVLHLPRMPLALLLQQEAVQASTQSLNW